MLQLFRAKPGNPASIYNIIIQILCVCLSSIGGQTAGPIMTKFGTYEGREGGEGGRGGRGGREGGGGSEGGREGGEGRGGEGRGGEG